MAQYNDFVTIDISSYDSFRNAILGNGYNVDGLYGDQCVDIPKLLTWNAGRTYPYWLSLPDGYAYEGWTNESNRTHNAGNLFTLVYNRADVKTGDLVVCNNTTSNPYGHIAFADSDWNASTMEAYLVGQNQENPSSTVGHYTTRTLINVTSFLGAFRFIAWQQPTPPTPTEEISKPKFPWVLYSNKIRKRY